MVLASAAQLAMIDGRPRNDLASFSSKETLHALDDLPPPGRLVWAGIDGRKPAGRRHDRHETRDRRLEVGRPARLWPERPHVRRRPAIRRHLRHRHWR